MNTEQYPKNIQHLITAVLTQAGNTSNELRQRVANHAISLSSGKESTAALPSAWQPYIDTVIKHAYRVTDKHTERLQTMGHSEDEIFELTISAALGSGLARLERGLTALEETVPNETAIT